jgi:hypothetical protein
MSQLIAGMTPSQRKRARTLGLLLIAVLGGCMAWNAFGPEGSTRAPLDTPTTPGSGETPLPGDESTSTPAVSESATPSFTPDYHATAVVMGTALAQQAEASSVITNAEGQQLLIFDVPQNGQLPEGACVLFYDQTKYVLPPFEGPYTKAECVAGAWNVGEDEALWDRNSDGDRNDTFMVSSPERRFR